jgi:hypothetical protein
VLRRASSEGVLKDGDVLDMPSQFQNDSLCRQFKRLGLLSTVSHSVEPPNKRRKVEPTPQPLSQLFRVLFRIFNEDYNGNFDDLPNITEYAFFFYVCIFR